MRGQTYGTNLPQIQLLFTRLPLKKGPVKCVKNWRSLKRVLTWNKNARKAGSVANAQHVFIRSKFDVCDWLVDLVREVGVLNILNAWIFVEFHDVSACNAEHVATRKLEMRRAMIQLVVLEHENCYYFLYKNIWKLLLDAAETFLRINIRGWFKSLLKW